MLEVKRNPAAMLPQIKRLMGLITDGWFSLMGLMGLDRGGPEVTK